MCLSIHMSDDCHRAGFCCKVQSHQKKKVVSDYINHPKSYFPTKASVYYTSHHRTTDAGPFCPWSSWVRREVSHSCWCEIISVVLPLNGHGSKKVFIFSTQSAPTVSCNNRSLISHSGLTKSQLGESRLLYAKIFDPDIRQESVNTVFLSPKTNRKAFWVKEDKSNVQ